MDAFALYCLDLTQIQGKQKKKGSKFLTINNNFFHFLSTRHASITQVLFISYNLRNHDFFFIIVAYQYLHVNKILFTFYRNQQEKVKVSKFQKQIFWFSFEPKNQGNCFLISTLRIQNRFYYVKYPLINIIKCLYFFI